jgi:hypothetical protein
MMNKGLTDMRLSTFLAATAATLALATASAASATQYLLQYSNSHPDTSFGTVDVTGTSTDLQFVVNLNMPFEIVDTGSHYAVSMNLSGSGFSLVAPAGFSLSTGSISNSPFGGFNVGVNCFEPACGNGASDPYGSSFTFHITGTGLGVLAADNFEGHPINFAVDVVSGQNTGTVGGGLGGGGGVPEPSAWALMILGFGGVGALMRDRRRTLATA